MNYLKRIEDFNKTLPVIELYTAVQSEGSRQGHPTVIIRTTGCTHRCYFGEGGWCDSWYTSIHPEKGKYTFNDIIKMYDENPHITEMMITGGAPTMHPSLVNELTLFASKRGIVTTIETEGSHFLPTQVPINLLSISPKFSNSIPVIGVKTPQGDVTDEKLIKQHEKFRLNLDAIAESIIYHDDYHIKPVFDEHLSILNEFELFIHQLAEKLHSKMYKRGFDKSASIPEIVKELKSKTWIMPAGDTREALFKSYPVIMDFCRDKGYKFTGREHIMAFNDKRCV